MIALGIFEWHFSIAFLKQALTFYVIIIIIIITTIGVVLKQVHFLLSLYVFEEHFSHPCPEPILRAVGTYQTDAPIFETS